MQHKSLQNRILISYIAFLAIVVAGVVCNIMPAASRGGAEGMELGVEIASHWQAGNSRKTFLLLDIPVVSKSSCPLAATAPDVEVQAGVRRLDLTVRTRADEGQSLLSVLFESVGGNAWLYLFVVLRAAACIAIIVLLGRILYSLWRSARSGDVFPPQNIVRTRWIGLLLIAIEIGSACAEWYMNRTAARLLAAGDITVVETFPLSWWNLMTGMLVFLLADIFAYGYKLSEEQKFTI